MDIAAQENRRTIDPFGFLVGHGSAIRPLGGAERGLDPRYVFHTPYVDFSPGRVILTIRFDGLRASFGELRVNINAYIPGSGRDAMFVTSSRLFLSDADAVERGLTMSILSIPGATYAAHGFCNDGTDATAEGLTITAEEFGAPDDAEAEIALAPSELADTPIEPAVKLVGDKLASFHSPVSQTMVADDLTDPDCRRLLAQLPAITDEKLCWKLAFTAQALDRYGMLRAGARGVGIGPDSAALAPILAAAGCEAVHALLPPRPAETELSWNGMPCVALGTSTAPTPLNLTAEPADRRGFDFLWSYDMAGEGYVAGHSAKFLIEQMAVLRPRGYAVHIFDLAPSGSDIASALPRAEVERVAVTLIARGYTVAQLNFDPRAAAQGAVPFALIVRKN